MPFNAKFYEVFTDLFENDLPIQRGRNTVTDPRRKVDGRRISLSWP